ncbi:MAG: efflux RND transporter permease subunit [Saprospiraceae bacterium]
MEENKKRSQRKFGITNFAVDNAISIFILAFMLMLFGINSYNSMPKEAYPEITFPQLFVVTPYFGNSAADIENLITDPLEEEIAEVDGLKKMTSKSLQDFSIITAEFYSDVDLSDANRRLKDAVDKGLSELPNDMRDDPEVLEVNFAELPIMTINLAGNFTNDELVNYAEYLEEIVEGLPEISEVDIKGNRDREVAIEMDLRRMQAQRVSFSDVEQAVSRENITMSGGELLTNDFRRNIRIVGEFKNTQEIENLIVKSEFQRSIYLKDIANVEFTYEDLKSIARADLEPVVSLDVIKKKGQNLLSAAAKIKKEIRDAEADVLPANMSVTLFNDMSLQTEMMVSNLQNSIIFGMILVILVLLLFLGTRNSLFVGIAIPLSMLMGILILNAIGYTMNMVLLFSLILALGLLVDNAIVVVENIYRYFQEGYEGMEAAKLGAGEVAAPIIISTATTLAAFIPLAFWPDLMGEFMRYIPITLIAVLLSSLFVALVINPVFTAAFMKVDEKANDPRVRKRKLRNVLIMSLSMLIFSAVAHLNDTIWLRNILWISTGVTLVNFFLLRPASFGFQNSVLPLLEKGYDNFIRFALRGANPFIIFAGTIFALVASFMLLGANMPKVVLFPVAQPAYVNAFIELPMGTDIESTDKRMREIEAKVAEVVAPYDQYVDAVLAQIGENTSDPNAGPEFGASPNKARLTVAFVPMEERLLINTTSIMDDIRSALINKFPGAQIVVEQNADGPPVGKPINIEITGTDIDSLALFSERMINFINLKSIGGIEELKKDVNLGKPELLVNIDREAASRYGVSTFAIADALRTSVFGKEISKFKTPDDDYPIQLRLAPEYRYDMDELLNQSITFRDMASGKIAQVPISAVADVSYSSTYSSINRKDEERMITIYSNVLDGYNPNEVVAEIQAELAEFNTPRGYEYKFTGEQEEMAANMAFLGNALLVALFAILIIMVGQFNSIISPFIIMLSVIFSFIGVLLGYVFSSMDLVIVMTGVGVISLAGIVVNNAIVLIDYINICVQRNREAKGVNNMMKMDREDVRNAVILGGATRLRPVLLTAITTVLGLIPLAIGLNFDFFGLITDFSPNFYTGGDNAAFWGTMAWTVIYGLVFSTFLTLIVIPVMYWLAYRAKRRVVGLFGGDISNDLETSDHLVTN